MSTLTTAAFAGRLGVLLLAVLIAACGSTGQGRPEVEAAGDGDDPGVVHVHGIGADPEDGTVYVATHTGLFTVEDGTARRVGDRYHDLMGFTIAGPDDFIASGHPDLEDQSLLEPGKPPLLGLVASDSGEEWQPVSLLGEVDFHSLQAAHGQVYGYDSTSSRFMVSRDRETWETRSQLPLSDFAVSPDDPDLIVGSTDRIVRSTDGGRTWEPVALTPLVALTWGQGGAVGVTPDGSVLKGDEMGEDWQPVGSLAGRPEALQAHEGTLYAWVSDQGLVASSDGGATWSVRYGVGG